MSRFPAFVRAAVAAGALSASPAVAAPGGWEPPVALDTGTPLELTRIGTPAIADIAYLGVLFDEPVNSLELARVALIKIDIEGAEAPVLRRLAETIALYPAKLQIIAELNPQSPNRALLDEALAALRNAGFEAYAVENKYQLIDYLRWRALCPLQPLDAVPDTQCDVLFRRPVLA